MLIIFDLDGTIFKTHSVVEAAIFSACNQLSLNPPKASDITAYLGKLEFDDYYATLFKDESPKTIQTIIQLVTKFLNTGGSNHGQLYDGTVECLQKLTVDHTLAICTNATAQEQDQKLISMGIDKYFSYKYPFDGTNKATRIHKLKSLCPFPSIMIGDMVTDIEAAKQSNILSIGVLWGYGTSIDLQDANYLVERFDEIPSIIQSINSF